MRSSTIVAGLSAVFATLAAVTTADYVPFGRPLSSRDASTTMALERNTSLGHQDHSTPKAPSGSRLTTLPVGSTSHTLAVYWTDSPKNSLAKQAFVMIHGRNRDGDAYWRTMSTILSSAISDNYPAADANAIIAAPQFYSAQLNSGQYAKDELAWGDINAWQAGEAAVHPRGAKETSFDALDAFFDEFSNTTRYPSLEDLVFVGHGGGGQLINRYSIVAKPMSSPTLSVRFIAGDPSSSAYFTEHRPTNNPAIASKSSCPMWNTWRYGFDNFTGTLDGLLTLQAYFKQNVARDVRYVVGNDDTAPNGDQYCMALLQGGVARRDRNLSWWKYINLLARTGEDLTGFPGNFTKEEIPDWSNLSGGRLMHTLTVIEGAKHNADEVFGSNEGRTVLFEKNGADVERGWRPEGYVARGTGAIAAPGTNTTSTSANAGGATGGSTGQSLLASSAGTNALRTGVAWIFVPLVLLVLGLN